VTYWKQKFSRLPFLEFKIEDMNNAKKICELFDRLRMEYAINKVQEGTIIKKNNRIHSKNRLSFSKSEAEKMNKQFQELLISKQHTLQAHLFDGV
jgi:hypothetical protein